MVSVELNRESPSMGGPGSQWIPVEKSPWLAWEFSGAWVAYVSSVGLSREAPMDGLGAQWGSVEDPPMVCLVCVGLLIEVCMACSADEALKL